MDNNLYDIVVIGGGAAGLTAAQYGSRAGMKVLLVEGSETGGQLNSIPELENYPGLREPVSGFEISKEMESQALKFGAEIKKDFVRMLDKSGSFFSVTGKTQNYHGKTVIIATGAEHKRLGIPGEDEFEGRGVSWCGTCDGPFFKNRKVAVIGGGDTACTEALFLSKIAGKIFLIHRRKDFRAQQFLLDRIQETPNIEIIRDSVPVEITGGQSVTGLKILNNVTGNRENLSVDGVFVFIGIRPRIDLVDALKKDTEGYIITDEKMETSLKGVFCAGDVRSKTFRQVVTACSDGAVAAHWAGEFVMGLNSTKPAI